jgi:hypothetical protein
MSFPRTGGARTMQARLESPRLNLCDALSGDSRSLRRRQLPTNHGHAARPFRATRAYQGDSSSKPPHVSAPPPSGLCPTHWTPGPEVRTSRHRLTPVLPYQVDDEIERGRLQHRQLGGLGALENSAGVDAGLAIGAGEACPVAD